MRLHRVGRLLALVGLTVTGGAFALIGWAAAVMTGGNLVTNLMLAGGLVLAGSGFVTLVGTGLSPDDAQDDARALKVIRWLVPLAAVLSVGLLVLIVEDSDYRKSDGAVNQIKREFNVDELTDPTLVGYLSRDVAEGFGAGEVRVVMTRRVDGAAVFILERDEGVYRAEDIPDLRAISRRVFPGGAAAAVEVNRGVAIVVPDADEAPRVFAALS